MNRIYLVHLGHVLVMLIIFKKRIYKRLVKAGYAMRRHLVM